MTTEKNNGQAREVDLGVGNEGSLLFRLALPAITAQIINVLYNMVDRMYIGHLEGIGANNFYERNDLNDHRKKQRQSQRSGPGSRK